MHQRKSRKILLYFFLLILLGSVNNINLKNFKIEKINIYGLNDYNERNLLKDIKNLKLENIFFLNATEIIEILNSNTLIENYEIFKVYPATLNIKIKKTKFLAKSTLGGKEFLVGSNGKLSESTLSKENLPYIFGKLEIQDFLEFKNIIDKSNLPYEKIKSFYFFKSKRWDIEIENGVLIKLSKQNTELSLNNEFLFLNNKKFNKNLIVDARVKNQIVIHE